MIRKNFLFILGALMLSIAYALPSEVFVKDLMKRGDFVVAEEQLKQLVASDPKNAKYDYWLAQAEERNKKYPQALVHLRRAIQLDPGLTFGKPQVVRSMEGRLVAINSVSTPAPKIKVTTTTTYGQPAPPVRVVQADPPPPPSAPWPLGTGFLTLGLLSAGALGVWAYWNWRETAIAKSKFAAAKATLLGDVLNLRKKIEATIDLNALSTKTYDAIVNGRLRSLLSSEVLPLLTRVQSLSFVHKDQCDTDLENAQRKLNNAHASYAMATRPEDDVEKASAKRDEYKEKTSAFDDVFRETPAKRVHKASPVPTQASYSDTQPDPRTPEVHHHHHHTTTVVSQPQRSLGDDLLTLAVADSLLHSHHTERPVVNNYYNEAPSTTVTREVEVDAPELDVDPPSSSSRYSEPELDLDTSDVSLDFGSSSDSGSSSDFSLDLD